MSTTFEKIYEPFFYKIENDNNFFVYYNISQEEALTLAKQRAKSLLIEAIAKLSLSLKNPDIDFTNYDIDNEIFNVDFTNDEINLIVQVMFERYLERDVVKLKALQMRYAPSDLKVFSPANERSSFLNMKQYVDYELEKLIDRYNSRDRLTGEMKLINYGAFEY